jgi:hypothetical protein
MQHRQSRRFVSRTIKNLGKLFPEILLQESREMMAAEPFPAFFRQKLPARNLIFSQQILNVCFYQIN